MAAEGTLIIISAPSGAGKTSLVTSLCREVPNLKKSVSHTTREIRVGERNGEHYNFVTKEQFAELLASDMFLEHADIYGQNYGTSKAWVTSTLQRGIDVILEIDWQGEQQIRSKMSNVLSIFILPPSVDILQQRLIDRKQDDQSKITIRMQQAKTEVSHYNEYDYLIVNDDFELALQQLVGIISASRLRVARQKQELAQLISQLLS